MSKRLTAAQRRAQIMHVAKELFAQHGLHGVSVDQLAETLKISPATLYKHFSSKEDLYEAVVDQTACSREDYVDAVVSGPADFANALRRLTQVFVDSVARDPDYLRMELQSALEANPLAGRFFENRWKHFTDLIELEIKERMARGEMRVVDPKAASLMFQGSLREVLYAKFIYRLERYRTVPITDLTNQMIDLFLRALDYRGRDD